MLTLPFGLQLRSHGGLSLSEVISELTILILLPLFALSHVHIGLPDTVIRDKANLRVGDK